MDVAAALVRDHADRGVEQLGPDGRHLVAVVGIDHELQGPGVVAPGDLGVGHRVVVPGLPRDQAGEPGPASLDQVQPGVVVERAVAVGPLGGGQQARDLGDVGRRHLALDLQAPHASAGYRWPRPGARAVACGSDVRARHPRRAARRPRTPKGRAREVARRLALEYPDAICELDHENPFQLLVATILSAQTTDVRVNMVTPDAVRPLPDRRRRWPAPTSPELEEIVRSTGFYANKSRSLVGMAQALVERFDGEVPTRLEDLVTLPGVGRKTANVVRSVAFDLPGLPVDTHVGRLSRRLGLTTEHDPVKVELDAQLLPAGGRAGSVQPPHDPPRPAGVRGPSAPLRGVRPGRHLPLRPGCRRPEPAPPAADLSSQKKRRKW